MNRTQRPTDPATPPAGTAGVANAPMLTVTARQLAIMLNVSERTIRMMDSTGTLPRPVRIGGRSVRWRVREIESWLEADSPDRLRWEALQAEGPGRPGSKKRGQNLLDRVSDC